MTEAEEDAITNSHARILATQEGEFRTRSIIAIGDDYFAVDSNGGTRGAWEVRYGEHSTTAQAIDRTEARRRLLEMDIDPGDVARWTA